MTLDPSVALYGMMAHAPFPWAAISVALVLLFGAALGSFVAAAAHRMLDGRSVIGPRSSCPACGTTLGLRDLAPLVSFAALKGRCRHCAARLSRGDAFVEWVGAILALFLLRATGGGAEFWSGINLAVVLGIATLTDLETRRIPLVLTRSGIAMGLAWAFLLGDRSGLVHLLATGVAVGVLFALNAVYVRVRRVEVAFGGGDVRLAGAIAAFLGPVGAPAALVVAATAGSLYGILAIALGRATLRSTIPFGPFLAFGGLLVLLGGVGLWGLLPLVD